MTLPPPREIHLMTIVEAMPVSPGQRRQLVRAVTARKFDPAGRYTPPTLQDQVDAQEMVTRGFLTIKERVEWTRQIVVRISLENQAHMRRLYEEITRDGR